MLRLALHGVVSDALAFGLFVPLPRKLWEDTSQAHTSIVESGSQEKMLMFTGGVFLDAQIDCQEEGR